VTTHFAGRVRLGGPTTVGAEEQRPLPRPGEGPRLAAEALYRVYFHGPAYRVLATAWPHDGKLAARLTPDLPPDREPADAPFELEPRGVELCFQTAGLWELGTAGRFGLPSEIDRVEVLGAKGLGTGGGRTAVVHPRADGGGFDAELIDDAGAVHLRLLGYRTAELPGQLAPEDLAPLRALFAEEESPCPPVPVTV
jgi:hypothetical protein